ncbi:MAG TPA: cation diffusion facilitator family transporter [Fibrobacteria bacterium]|nr:cation diffusion facilitator family transporter [Fibrobacteria bacterium]
MESSHAHSHEHGHEHGHGHSRGHQGHHGHSHHAESGLPHVHHASYGKLLTSFWIIAVFMGVEIACGWWFHSLTLMSDGFHMLSDAVALGLSAFAVSLGSRKATEAKTFGFKRLEILAAFGNGLTLILLSLFIIGQALIRLAHPVPVDAEPMLWVASLGLAVNVFVAWWLHRGGQEKTINEAGAFWHVMGDLGASLAAVAAAALILAKGWTWADPLLSLAIAAALVIPGVRVMRRSGHILVEGTPEGVELEAVRNAMLANRQVRNVHDLHLWTMNGRDLYLSAHVETVPGAVPEKEVAAALTRSLSRDFRVDHITLQVGQCVDDDCPNNCEDPARPVS